MLEISDAAAAALERDHAARAEAAVDAALRDAHPEDFAGLDDAASRRRTHAWLGYVQEFRIAVVDNIVALYGLWHRWGGFRDPDSKWILEILRGPLHEDEKIAALHELLY